MVRTKKGWDIDAINPWHSAELGSGEETAHVVEQVSEPVVIIVDSVVRMITIELPTREPDPETKIAKQNGHLDVKIDRFSQLPAFGKSMPGYAT